MLYNINIKIIGDTWDNQELHDSILEFFRSTTERLLSNAHLSDFRGDINFEYHVNEKKFTLISAKGKLADNVKYVFEINREFRRKYLK